MQKQEFELRTKLTVTDEEYSQIEEMYISTDLDKDLFCKFYIESPIALKEIVEKTLLTRELFDERKCHAQFLLEQAEKWSASDLRERAIQMMGIEKYLRAKLERGYSLWESDKQALIEILNKK